MRSKEKNTQMEKKKKKGSAKKKKKQKALWKKYKELKPDCYNP